MIEKQRALSMVVAAFAILFLVISTACVDIETDPEPPYPVKHRDYSYPEDEHSGEPWNRPADFPNVVLSSPTTGEFVSGGTVLVEGTYAGPELASLTINGTDVTLQGDTFSMNLDVPDRTGTFSVIAKAVTTEGLGYADRATLILGEPGDIDATVFEGISIDLENRGLKSLSMMLSDLLDGAIVTSQTKAALANDENYKGLFEVTNVSLDDIDIVLESQDDGLGIKLGVSGVDLGISILGSAVNIEVDGLIADTLNELGVTEEGTLEILSSSAEIGVGRISIEAALIPDSIEGIIDTALELLLPALVNGLVEGAVSDLLNDLLSGISINITSDDFTYAMAFSTVFTTDAHLVLGMSTTADLLNVANPDLQPDGYLKTDSDPLVYPALSPVSNLPYGIAIALDDDMFNQLMYILTASGLLNFSITDDLLTTEAYSLIFFSYDEIDPALPMALEFEPKLAPMIFADPEQPERMMLQIPHFEGRALVDRGEEGMWESMSFSVDVNAPLTVETNYDGSIGLLLEQLDITVTILHNPVGQKNTENLNRLFKELFSAVLPDLLRELNVNIDPVAISGMQLNISDISSFGSDASHLGIFLDLDY